MRRIFSLSVVFLLLSISAKSQTPLTYAPDFWVKTLEGQVLELYPILDQNKIVVLDFFSVSCGPCQFYAYDFQLAYEAFGSNQGNVFFLAINYNGTVSDVRFFDSLYNITLPSVSGLDGGGNAVFHQYQVAAYPSVIVIKPDRSIASQYIWPPTAANIQQAVTVAGGTLVGLNSALLSKSQLQIVPNPVADDRVMLHFFANKPGQTVVNVYDIQGRLVEIPTSVFPLSKGENTIELRLGMMKSGIYIVEISDETHQKHRSLLMRN